MGGGTFDPGAYRSAASTRKASGVDDFDYDRKVKTGTVRGIHASLDPKWVAGATSPLAGQNVRESRDSDEHPNTLPVAFMFDVTGSMQGIPRVLQTKLPNLLDVIIAKADIRDPNILMAAIGDSNCDDYPFQVGQFESDNRFDEQLRNFILEGGGGGQDMESYMLAYYFAAFHTATDAWEKRGKKGYLFTMGDEAFWPTVTKADIKRLFGVDAERDYGAEELFTLASERWEVFHLFAAEGSNGRSTSIPQRWRNLIGERFIVIQDSSLICETVAGLIHMLEGAHDVDRVLSDVGVSGSAANTVKNALMPVAKSRMPTHVASGTLPEADAGAGKVTRV